ncbi:S-adenosyl-L-methionine-dependent methyltransferase [Cladorrhinum sp. PSN259]|nr:S-adenosyl-L-methionine-dependent methyltransferase [Cladorrhinum sp. PSN259]
MRPSIGNGVPFVLVVWSNSVIFSICTGLTARNHITSKLIIDDAMAAIPSKEEVAQLVRQLNEVAENYDDTPDLNGYISRTTIIGKAKELQRALITSDQTPHYHGLNMAELVAIRTFIKLKILDAIPPTGAISLSDLSEVTGAQESLIERMARILVQTGFLSQPSPSVLSYSHTKFSLSYLLDTPTSPGYLFLAMYDQWFKHVHNFDDYLEARGQLSSAREPDDPVRNPFTHYHGKDGTPVWEIMASNPEKLEQFQRGMSGIDVAIPVTGHFDFDALKNSEEENARGVVELVDVGGGHGEVLKQILERHKALSAGSVVLQERADIARLAKGPGSVLPEGVSVQEHDFMTVQPVKGAKAYFTRMILHDYSDEVATQILKNLVPAMSHDSRVLVCEMVLPQRVDETSFAAAVLDQAVMAMGGKERTEEGFRKVFEAAGLELVKVWRAPGVPGGCVEGRLKRSE